MQIGIAGLPGSGKTTLFNALAHQHAQVGGYAGAEPNLAVVKVPDERLDKLSALFQPKKHTPAEVRFVDVAGVAKGMGQESTAAVLAHLRTVGRAAAGDRRVSGRSATPRSDFEEFNLELQLADLGQIEKRLERLEKELRLGSKGTPQERAVKERELAVLETAQAGARSRASRSARSSCRRTSRRPSRAFGFLTQKPTLVVLNLADEQDPTELLGQLRELTAARAADGGAGAAGQARDGARRAERRRGGRVHGGDGCRRAASLAK